MVSNDKKIKKNKGFTLIEVIVATMIIVVAAIPLLSTFVVSSRLNMKGRIKEQAMTVAENTVESIKALGAESTLEWVEANGSKTPAVLTNSASAAKSATPNIVKKEDATTTLSEGTEDKEVTIADSDFYFTISNVYMGKSYYDVYVTVNLDMSDDNNVRAYLKGDNYKSAYGVNIIKYYRVGAYVFPGDTLEVGVELTDMSSAIARYTGTFVSKN